MGFFKEFRDDLSKAVNELLPDDDQKQVDQDEPDGQEVQETEQGIEPESEQEEHYEPEFQENIVNTLDFDEIASDEDPESEKMKEILDEFTQEEEITEEVITEIEPEAELDELDDDIEFEEEGEGEEDMDDNVDLEILEALNAEEEEIKEEATDKTEKASPKLRAAATGDDTVTVISKGTIINGSISSDGSLDIMGSITGDVECLGKLTISGKIVGNSSAAEVYVNTERLEGGITSEGSVKIGLGTVVIGDIVATSGVIAGAVKGEIDVNGPIVIDSTAIIKGNIKAKAVQINNGAVIEGFCSLSYSEVDLDNVFE